jgi:heat shock protein HtpX
MYSEIAANKRKTIFLMLGFILIVGLLATVVALYYNNFFITGFTLTFAVIYMIWSYFGSASAALSMNNAVQIEKQDSPELFRIVENLAITTGIPMPKVYIINDPALNAFATGRDPNHSSVAITTGLLEKLDKNELEGVMAHELGHIQNYDIRLNIVAFGLVALVSIISDIILRNLFWNNLFGDRDNNNNNNPILYLVLIVSLIIAPIVANIIKLAVSRKREYLADATGALTTRYPEGLASALNKIEQYGSQMQKQNSSTAHLFFASPLKGEKLTNLFSTHPPIQDRIAKLRAMNEKA